MFAPLAAEYLGYVEKIFGRHLRILAVLEQMGKEISHVFAPSSTQFLGNFETLVWHHPKTPRFGHVEIQISTIKQLRGFCKRHTKFEQQDQAYEIE